MRIRRIFTGITLVIAALALTGCDATRFLDDKPAADPIPSVSGTMLPGSELIAAGWKPEVEDLSGANVANTGESVLQPLMAALAHQETRNNSYADSHKTKAWNRIKQSKLKAAYEAKALRAWTNPDMAGIAIYTLAASKPLGDTQIVLMKVTMDKYADNLAGYARPEGNDLVGSLAGLADRVKNLPQVYHQLGKPVETSPPSGNMGGPVANGFVGYIGLQ